MLQQLPLPSIILGNAQSMRSKTYELEACTRFIHQFRETNLICLGETWLSGKDPDHTLPGFTLMRSDNPER